MSERESPGLWVHYVGSSAKSLCTLTRKRVRGPDSNPDPLTDVKTIVKEHLGRTGEVEPEKLQFFISQLACQEAVAARDRHERVITWSQTTEAFYDLPSPDMIVDADSGMCHVYTKAAARLMAPVSEPTTQINTSEITNDD